MTISRSRIVSVSCRPSSYRPQPCMAPVIGRWRANTRNKPIGGTPAGIMLAS